MKKTKTQRDYATTMLGGGMNEDFEPVVKIVFEKPMLISADRADALIKDLVSVTETARTTSLLAHYLAEQGMEKYKIRVFLESFAAFCYSQEADEEEEVG